MDNNTSPMGMSEADEAAFLAMQSEQPAPEPIETEEPEVEVAEQPEGEGQSEKAPQQGKRPTTVPHQALHEERERRKAVEAEAQKLREERAALNERFRIINEMQNRAQEAPQEEMPDPEQDPLGAIRWQTRELNRLREEQAQFNQREQQGQQHNTFVRQYQAQAQAFAKETPEFNDAYQHLFTSRVQELMLTGYSQGDAQQLAIRDEEAIARSAMQQGKNPASVMMELAKHRGWQAPAKEDPQETAVKKVETAARGVSTNRSLSSAGGMTGSTEMTPETALKMSNDEFAAWCDKNPAKARKLLGG